MNILFGLLGLLGIAVLSNAGALKNPHGVSVSTSPSTSTSASVSLQTSV